MEFDHTTVLLNETIDGLNLKEEGIYVDCTLGGGGHTKEIFRRLKGKCKVIGIDQDDYALDFNREQFKTLGYDFVPYKSNFSDLKNVLVDLKIDSVDGIVFDLGVSSPQLDLGERGFSYNHDAPLDMRMDRNSSLSAMDVVNHWKEEELAKIMWEYSDEKWAKRIAQFIVEYRPINTTLELVGVIKRAVPKGARKDGPHPAKRTFQAIRIAVNDEIGVLKKGIQHAIDSLKPGGRISVITFHSLEDRIIKNIYKDNFVQCICPKEYPVCVCDHQRKVKIITRKPLEPTIEELEANPRARSAKLRVAERV